MIKNVFSSHTKLSAMQQTLADRQFYLYRMILET